MGASVPKADAQKEAILADAEKDNFRGRYLASEEVHYFSMFLGGLIAVASTLLLGVLLR